MADITIGSSTSNESACPELSLNDGIVTTTSIQVALHFKKRHADVIRSVKKLEEEMSDKERQRIFALTSQEVAGPHGALRHEPMYFLTRDGFMLLAMGFTGKEALRWKLAYIAAFNRMEAELQKPAQDPQRIQLAHRLAAQAAAQVTQTVFEAVMAGDNTHWRYGRYLLNLGYDHDGQASVPRAQLITDQQMVVSFEALPQRIANDDVLRATDAQLATLATACTQRLTERAQQREKLLAKPDTCAPQTAPGLPSGKVMMRVK